MTLVRLEPAALRSRVKHSTTEPLRSLYMYVEVIHELQIIVVVVVVVVVVCVCKCCIVVVVFFIIGCNYSCCCCLFHYRCCCCCCCCCCWSYNAFYVYRRELAPGTVSLTCDRAQGDDSKNWAYSTVVCVSVVQLMCCCCFCCR